MSTEQELVMDLREVGILVSSVWDLVNGPNNYDVALQVLIRHLKSAEDLWFKEGIVRALGVKGFNNAVNPLISEYHKSEDKLFKWAIANSLSIIAPSEALDELIEIMGDKRHKGARQMIAEALGRIGDRKAIPVLLEALEDEEVEGQAVIALGMLGDESVIEFIKPFLKNKRKWIKKAAKRAIDRIKKRCKSITNVK